MKLILCGKGGCGKSTVSALLARAWAARGYQVLVIDADESNFGLHKQLGLDLPEDFTHYFGHKKGIMAEGAQDVFQNGWHLEDIPNEYCSRDGAVRLMAIGKIAEAGEGCACAMGALAKIFLEHLILREDEVVIVDTEAGVEHFGRGVDKYADAILMVADPSFESIQLSGKICEMGKAFNKPVYIVLNRVNDEQMEWMKANMPYPEAVIAGVPMDDAVFLSGMKGEAITKTIPGVETILARVTAD
jgi:CO dehydrogenase maturation factor